MTHIPEIVTVVRIFLPTLLLLGATVLFFMAYRNVNLRFLKFGMISSGSLLLWSLGTSIAFYQSNFFTTELKLRTAGISLVFMVLGFLFITVGVKSKWDTASIVALMSAGSMIGLLAHSAIKEDIEIIAFRETSSIIYVAQVSEALLISSILLGATAVISIREYVRRVTAPYPRKSPFYWKNTVYGPMVLVGTGIFAYIAGIAFLSIFGGVRMGFLVLVTGAILFAAGYFYLGAIVYFHPIVLFHSHTSIDGLIKEGIISAAIVTLDYDGPTPRLSIGYEKFPNKEDLLVKLSLGYMTMIAQGESFPEGVFVLPFPETRNYESIVASCFLLDPNQIDPRFKGRTYVLFVITYPRGMASFFNKREASEKALKHVLKGTNSVGDLSKHTLKEYVKQFLVAILEPENED